MGSGDDDNIGLEANHELGMYLCIRRPRRPESAKSEQSNRYCGRCTHAYGLSRKGAKSILEYEKKNSQEQIDMLLEEWCKEEGGLPVSHVDKKSNQVHGIQMRVSCLFTSAANPEI